MRLIKALDVSRGLGFIMIARWRLGESLLACVSDLGGGE